MKKTVTMREFLELKIQHERELREVHEKEIERRLEGMNELREQINGERGNFVLREMYDTKHEELAKRLGMAETKLSDIRMARATLNWIWSAALAAAALLIAVLSWLTRWRFGQH